MPEHLPGCDAEAAPPETDGRSASVVLLIDTLQFGDSWGSVSSGFPDAVNPGEEN